VAPISAQTLKWSGSSAMAFQSWYEISPSFHVCDKMTYLESRHRRAYATSKAFEAAESCAGQTVPAWCYQVGLFTSTLLALATAAHNPPANERATAHSLKIMRDGALTYLKINARWRITHLKVNTRWRISRKIMRDGAITSQTSLIKMLVLPH